MGNLSYIIYIRYLTRSKEVVLTRGQNRKNFSSSCQYETHIIIPRMAQHEPGLTHTRLSILSENLMLILTRRPEVVHRQPSIESRIRRRVIQLDTHQTVTKSHVVT